jgi:hypothetical protein
MVKSILTYTAITSILSIASAMPLITKSSSGILAVSSPSYFPNFPFHGANAKYPVPSGPLSRNSNLNKEKYPEAWTEPDVNHPEVQRAIRSIDWKYVPKFKPRTMDMEYDEITDDACWWSNSQCTTPNVDYLPQDVKFCPNVGDFGLVMIAGYNL